jgi:hypothetical protein
MLADQLDYVIGVDPHRDVHAVAVEVRTGGVVFETAIAANSAGYRLALALAAEHAPGRRAFAVEGSGSFGAGLTRSLTARRAGLRGRPVAPRTTLERQDRCTRRDPGRTDRALSSAAVTAARRRPTRGSAGIDGSPCRRLLEHPPMTA